MVVLPVPWLLVVGAFSVGVPTTDLEARAVAIGRSLLAPCCYAETVEVHQSLAAQAMRHEIRDMLRRGISDADIVAFYVDRYGQRILATPPREFAFGLYGPPILAVLVGTLAVLWLLGRSRARLRFRR